MLGVLSLCDAYYMGVDTATPSAIEECIKTELECEDYREFLGTGKFNRYTYSFRLQKNMAERVALAGGKGRFARLLDSFFGFGKESVRQMTHTRAHADISKANYHRFEGFNNECDMETPYA